MIGRLGVDLAYARGLFAAAEQAETARLPFEQARRAFKPPIVKRGEFVMDRARRGCG